MLNMSDTIHHDIPTYKKIEFAKIILLYYVIFKNLVFKKESSIHFFAFTALKV